MSRLSASAKLSRVAGWLVAAALLGSAAYRQRWNPLLDGANRARVAVTLGNAPAILRTEKSLLFIFQPQDCPQSKHLIAILDSLYRGRVPIVAVLVADSTAMPDWREFIVNSGMSFPAALLSPDEALVVARQVNRGTTPVIVMFDRRNRDFSEMPDTIAAQIRTMAAES